MTSDFSGDVFCKNMSGQITAETTEGASQRSLTRICRLSDGHSVALSGAPLRHAARSELHLSEESVSVSAWTVFLGRRCGLYPPVRCPDSTAGICVLELPWNAQQIKSLTIGHGQRLMTFSAKCPDSRRRFFALTSSLFIPDRGDTAVLTWPEEDIR